jgi:hypothetical protein
METVQKWKPFDPNDVSIQELAKVTPIYLFGKWKAFDILPGGDPEIVVANYGTWSANFADESSYFWAINFTHNMDDYNVDFTHYAEMEYPTEGKLGGA